jgi:glucan phosphoethanolaminetransferase (alkaline phosphatase superfamily)
VVVVSDHGEEFVEHGGWNHGETLYEEQVEIPWLMRIRIIHRNESKPPSAS